MDEREQCEITGDSNMSTVKTSSNVDPKCLEDGEVNEQSPSLQAIPVDPDSSEPVPKPCPDPLPITPEQLDRAKSLVLDLLGWGVEPEYLVQCGVSSPVLHRIFSDLRLRLPTNLNMAIEPSEPDFPAGAAR